MTRGSKSRAVRINCLSSLHQKWRRTAKVLQFQLPKTGLVVGVDLGINRLATLSNGERIHNPQHTRKFEKKLAKAQRILSRRKKGSGRWNTQRLKVARIHQHIADSRNDHLNKVTTDLVKRFDVIALAIAVTAAVTPSRIEIALNIRMFCEPWVCSVLLLEGK